MLHNNLPPNAQRNSGEDAEDAVTLEMLNEDGPQTERVEIKAPLVKKSVLQYNPLPPKKTVPKAFDFQTTKRT